MSPRARALAAAAVHGAMTVLTWALFAVCVAALLASCAPAKATPPDAYAVIVPTTTLAEPAYTPVPAGPPAEASR